LPLKLNQVPYIPLSLLLLEISRNYPLRRKREPIPPKQILTRAKRIVRSRTTAPTKTVMDVENIVLIKSIILIYNRHKMKKNLIYSGGKSHGIRKGGKTKKAPPARWLTPGGNKGEDRTERKRLRCIYNRQCGGRT